MLPNPERQNNKNRPFLKLEALRSRSEMIVAEVGVQYGYNALRILSTLNIKTIYLIDSYQPYPSAKDGTLSTNKQSPESLDFAKEYLKSYQSKIVWIIDYSWNAHTRIPDEELDFVYIDGDHRVEIVCKDVELYMPKVKKGGYIAGHDYTRKYVKDGISKYFGSLDKIKHEGEDWWIRLEK